MKAEDLLKLKILEPAMGAAAFQNEVINQLAELYLTYRQKELGKHISPHLYLDERQKVKAYIATKNIYGVDLNPTAIELGTSYALEWITGSWPWQTYVDYDINFQARIALSPSIRFGIGGVFFLYCFQLPGQIQRIQQPGRGKGGQELADYMGDPWLAHGFESSFPQRLP